jgi:HPt (histidine-containing phosphotransfer) domain-containing protein
MHTLKGTAGTIGAGLLAQQAQAVEQALAAGDADAVDTIESLLTPLGAGCSALIEALGNALPQEAPSHTDLSTRPAPGDTGDTSALTAETLQLLEQLEALLADDDADAIELFQELAPALRSALGPVYADMERALDAYQFVEALAALRTVLHAETPASA